MEDVPIISFSLFLQKFESKIHGFSGLLKRILDNFGSLDPARGMRRNLYAFFISIDILKAEPPKD